MKYCYRSLEKEARKLPRLVQGAREHEIWREEASGSNYGCRFIFRIRRILQKTKRWL